MKRWGLYMLSFQVKYFKMKGDAASVVSSYIVESFYSLSSPDLHLNVNAIS